MRRARLLSFALFVSGVLPGFVLAQGTLADYQRAEEVRERFDVLGVTSDVGRPTWIGQTSHFWYRTSVLGGDEFVWVDAETQEKRPAFDHQRLAKALSAMTDTSYTALTLPFREIEFLNGERALAVSFEGMRYTCDLSSYMCEGEREADRRGGWTWGSFPPEPEAESEPIASPDKRYEAQVRNYNVYVRNAETGEMTPLSTDGNEGNYYAPRTIEWSPDSRRIAAYRVKPGYRRAVHYIESSPEDQLQPKHSTRFYAKPGDVLDLEQPVLFDVERKRQIIIDNALFPNPYGLSALEWWEDGRAFTFEYNQRGHEVYRVIEVDAETGQARALISEEPETFFYYRHSSEQGKKFRYDVDDGEEVIWMSERDGWNHLYLYDGATGEVKNQVTQGEWVVRGVDSVDVAKRQIWFHASGMHPGKDPYYIHYFRVGFDGSDLTPLTDAHGTHEVTYAPDMNYYVDTWSRVDLAPVSQIRRTSDGAVLMELERSDLTNLLATGWRAPEVFTALSRDGETEIWGVITRPTNFDSSKTYPVIENIYAGPQYSFVPKAFSLNLGMQALAELGFIVVQIDGMGTSNRSKAFHDVAWKDLGDAGFPDRILWHKAVAEDYAYYDTSRVGIYGTSAGGQSSLGALLFHPAFYDVAVSASGCHDNRMDKIWWNELWMSWPIGPQYAASSNVDNAHRLQGELLLIVGEMDTNVDPASTYQVVNALIDADKDFDLLVIPGAGHTSGGEYGEHKRRDFFVEHLLGVDSPEWDKVAAVEEEGS